MKKTLINKDGYILDMQLTKLYNDKNLYHPVSWIAKVKKLEKLISEANKCYIGSVKNE